ncbi:trehalase family glycosidase [Aquimarina sediminis]|uniref:trehalase family glycosidase n=1 Tax=Aquimarina sediminis TaxID=2070536 RepID=UPI000CA07CA9|nr:trehalase family glycosidase [Aquimarina sediminis]
MQVKVHKESVLKELLTQEDTDQDKKITIEDRGPKKFKILTVNSEIYTIEGTYYLSNLLQELKLAKEDSNGVVEISIADVTEQPGTRISKMIKEFYWDRLTRRLDQKGIDKILSDEKFNTEEKRLYIPYGDSEAFRYYKEITEGMEGITLEILPKEITPEYVRSINDKPGILGLGLTHENNKKRAIPFLVPGGRFNEMYGWDSYFINIGLLLDDKKELARGMIDNFTYQIQNYGKILNANRSYYLTRTQPPFYTSMVIEYYKKYKDQTSVYWLEECTKSAIYEYETVWMQPQKRLASNGLNRFYAEGIGITPEAEEGHYDYVLKKHKKDDSQSVREFEQKYLQREIENKALDEYFLHDRSVRESGHDTTYRLEGICADLTTVDLNTLLYKYEKDLSYIIKEYFGDDFTYEGRKLTSKYWNNKAFDRLQSINQYLWDTEKGSYFDYDLKARNRTNFESATGFYPLWANLCTTDQAKKLINYLLPKLKCKFGIAASSESSLNHVPKDAPKRQWDYPFGWAPHQMMIWRGLLNYGYKDLADELVYRWLWMITINAIDYNGVIPEKFDVVRGTYKIDVEYGNVGSDFKYVPDGGFGWMNASYKLGMSYLSQKLKDKLNELIHPDEVFLNK